MQDAGLIYESPSETPFDLRWDPIPDGDPYDVDPSGLLGEDKGGVWARVHPDLILDREPEIWGVVDEFFSGRRRISERDWQTKSNKELEAKQALVAATNREQARAYRRENPSDVVPEGEV